jgi:hypothetical protein
MGVRRTTKDIIEKNLELETKNAIHDSTKISESHSILCYRNWEIGISTKSSKLKDRLEDTQEANGHHTTPMCLYNLREYHVHA